MRVYFTQQQATQTADQLNLARDGNQHYQAIVQLQTSGFGAVNGKWRVIWLFAGADSTQLTLDARQSVSPL